MNRFEPRLLFDSLMSWERHQHSRIVEKGTDSKGDFEIVNYYGKKPCKCHPETCPHFDGEREYNYNKKIYK